MFKGPDFGTPEYYLNGMRFWVREAVRLRNEYDERRREVVASGKDYLYWETSTVAKGIVAQQRDARAEATMFATALAAELAYTYNRLETT
jgi:hypothetical protein